MARITFSVDEVVNIIKLNVNNLPRQIKEIDTDGSHIRLLVNIGKLIPNFAVMVIFHTFNNDILQFKLISKAPLKILLKFIKCILKKFLSNYELTINRNIIQLNINNLISQKIKGVKVKSIIEKNGTFEIGI